jgi:release factor glutamine methyltransferase
VTDLAALLSEGANRLAAAGIENPRREARLLLAHALFLDPNEIFHLPLVGRSEIRRAEHGVFPGGGPVFDDRPPPGTLRVPTSAQGGGESEYEHFELLIARRSKHEPLAYITGVREFWSLEFNVGPGVLIPRPETETLIEETLKEFPDKSLPLTALDLGTGSACLPIAFLSEYSSARALGVDAAEQALGWARANVEKHGLTSRCTLRLGNWADGVDEMFDAIFSNPPYIESATIPVLDPDVADYEPRNALDGGSDGLDAYRALSLSVAARLKPGGRAFVELGIGQADAVSRLFSEAGLETIRVVPDLSGIARCLVAARAA